MAFKMAIEAADGRTVEDAYWIPAQINVGVADKGGNITFLAYSSPEAMDAGKAPIAGAVKSYAFTPDEFNAATQLPMSALFPQGISGENILYEVLGRFAYGVALSRQDVENEDGTMRSFFENAENV